MNEIDHDTLESADKKNELESRLNRKLKNRKVPPGGSESHALVVNGKVKNIGKKSQYLLDMLTLDDE